MTYLEWRYKNSIHVGIRILDPVRCLCYARDVTDDDIAFYHVDECGWLWAHYYDCPKHGGRQISAKGAPGFVARDDEAIAVQAVAVEIEAL